MAHLISAGLDVAAVVAEQNPIPILRHVDPIRRVPEFAGFNEVGGNLSKRDGRCRNGKCQKNAGGSVLLGTLDLAGMVADCDGLWASSGLREGQFAALSVRFSAEKETAEITESHVSNADLERSRFRIGPHCPRPNVSNQLDSGMLCNAGYALNCADPFVFRKGGCNSISFSGDEVSIEVKNNNNAICQCIVLLR